MTLYKDKYRIESTRLKDWDYSRDGYYFVTICTQDKKCFFGDVIDEKVRFYPIRDVEGKYLYSVHIMEDITEAKRTQERLRQEMEITTDLLTIAEITSHTIDINKLMEQVMRHGSKIVGCDVCLSYLWNKEMKIFQPDHCHGLPSGLMPVFHTQPLDVQREFVKWASRGGPVVISVAVLMGKGLRTEVPPIHDFFVVSRL